MSSLVHGINQVLGLTFDVLFWPLQLGGEWGLVCGSASVAALVLVAGWRRLSDQPRLGRSRDRVLAAVLALRLFQTHPSVVLRAQVRVLGRTLIYLGHGVRPALLLAPLLILGYLQLDGRLGRQPLRPGEAAVVTATLSEAPGFGQAATARLEGDPGIAVETAGVRAGSLGQVSWRVRAHHDGAHQVVLHAGGVPVAKTVVVGPHRGLISPVRARGWAVLAYPGEPPIPAGSGVAALTVAYPEHTIRLARWAWPWALPFTVVLLCVGYAAKQAWDVEI